MSTLLDLMALDPLKCTRKDITEIIAFFREKRKQFNMGNLTAGKVKAPSAKLTEALKLAPTDLDL